MNFFKVTLSDGQSVNVALTPQDRGWVAQVGDAEVTLKLLGSDGRNSVSIEVDGQVVEMDLNSEPSGTELEEQLARALQRVIVERSGLAGAAPAGGEEASSSGVVESPMAGIVLQVLVDVGQTVETGDCIAIIEAMKMENRVDSTASGVVTRIVADVGATLLKGDPLLEVSEIIGDGPNQDESVGASNVTT